MSVRIKSNDNNDDDDGGGGVVVVIMIIIMMKYSHPEGNLGCRDIKSIVQFNSWHLEPVCSCFCHPSSQNNQAPLLLF